VAYDYRITEYQGSGKHRKAVTHFRGSALTPSVIVTRSGRHRLLTVPDLQGRSTTAPLPIRIANFERHLQSTAFTRVDAAAQEQVDRWTDDDGAYRGDVSYRPPDGIELHRCMLSQQHVPPGALVCAIGTYSAARQGLVPSATWAASPRLIAGDLGELRQTLGASARRQLLLGLAAALLAAGLLAAFVLSLAGE
jgi:hypothetical protein